MKYNIETMRYPFPREHRAYYRPMMLPGCAWLVGSSNWAGPIDKAGMLVEVRAVLWERYQRFDLPIPLPFRDNTLSGEFEIWRNTGQTLELPAIMALQIQLWNHWVQIPPSGRPLSLISHLNTQRSTTNVLDVRKSVGIETLIELARQLGRSITFTLK